MNKTAFIQIQPNGQILNQGSYTAYYGFVKLGYKIVFYGSLTDFVKKAEYPPNVVVGGINTLRSIMDALGVKQPKVPLPHVELPDYLMRTMKIMNLKYFRYYADSASFKPTFIKPLTQDKAFTGFVYEHAKDSLQLKKFHDDFELLTSEVIELQSEFRVFIQNGKIIDCKNYTGNFWLRPNPHTIQEAVRAYKNQPAAYTLDWGIDINGNTLLIEINDAFGVAPYGLDPVKYAQFLETRWQELMTQVQIES